MEIDMDKLHEGLQQYFFYGEGKPLWDDLRHDPVAAIGNGKLGEFIGYGVRVVEDMYHDAEDLTGLEGSDKIDALASWLDDVIRLPMWLEPFDGMIIKALITGVVDLFNRKWGHVWPTLAEDGTVTA